MGILLGIWPFPNGVPGVECLWYGLFGLMANVQGGPPNVDEKPMDFKIAVYVLRREGKVHVVDVESETLSRYGGWKYG